MKESIERNWIKKNSERSKFCKCWNKHIYVIIYIKKPVFHFYTEGWSKLNNRDPMVLCLELDPDLLCQRSWQTCWKKQWIHQHHIVWQISLFLGHEIWQWLFWAIKIIEYNNIIVQYNKKWKYYYIITFASHFLGK